MPLQAICSAFQVQTSLTVCHPVSMVQVHYLERPASSYVKAAVQTVQDIHREGLPGDVLVFLTGKVFRV